MKEGCEIVAKKFIEASHACLEVVISVKGGGLTNALSWAVAAEMSAAAFRTVGSSRAASLCKEYTSLREGKVTFRAWQLFSILSTESETSLTRALSSSMIV